MTLGHSNWTICSPQNLFLQKEFPLYSDAKCTVSLFLHAIFPRSRRSPFHFCQNGSRGHGDAIFVLAAQKPISSLLRVKLPKNHVSLLWVFGAPETQKTQKMYPNLFWPGKLLGAKIQAFKFQQGSDLIDLRLTQRELENLIFENFWRHF